MRRLNLPALDYHAITAALFLPLLLWTGSVIAISLFGYPGVVCMTPAAWLLALPVGLRVGRESTSLGDGPVLEAATGGLVLGIWQGVLFAMAMSVAPHLIGRLTVDPPSPILAAVAVALVSVPVTVGLSALSAWLRARASHTGAPGAR